MLDIAQPPHALEAEQSVIGALLLDNQALDRIPFLEVEHFYRHDHRIIFGAIKEMIERRGGCDLVTLCDRMGPDLERTPGPAYLGQVMQSTPGAFNVHRYAELVRDKWVLRMLAQKGMEIAERAHDTNASPAELAEDAGAAFLNIEIGQPEQDMVDFGAATVEAVEWADNPTKGLATGYEEVDKILGGLMPGDLVIVAGRPSMGKTALAMNIAEHVARREQVAVFSLEMTRRKVAGRALKWHESRVGRDRAVDHLYSLKLHIDDTAAISLSHMRVRLRRLKRKYGLALVVVDYLQLMTAKAERRLEEVSTISRGLKAIAKEFGVPVIAVAQLNRAADSRPDNRPLLSDLRESGQIEQDADVIAFVYRDEYYRPDTQWRGIAEVIVRKNRDGAIGTAFLRFVPEYTRFLNYDGTLPQPEEPKPEAARRSVVSVDFKRESAGDR